MVKISGKIIPILHTCCALMAFIVTFIIGYSLHFHKIVRNAHYGYPDEWFPSVSATIGDRYPERSVFQILIALTAFPRFLLLLGHYYLNGSIITLIVGVCRTVSCGGWVYITSTDDHDTHDIFMIVYIVLTLPWDILITTHSASKTNKVLVTTTFFTILVPMLYWYYQHQVMHLAGAYSIYAYFEWSLILLDVLFDGLSYTDFKAISIDLNKVSITEKSIITKMPNKKSKKSNNSTSSNISVTTKDRLENPTIFSYDSFVYILTNIINSFFFWTGITSLYCMVWYFPMWHLGLTGYEVTIFSTTGCIFLIVPFISDIINHYGTLFSGLIITGAYLFDEPETRLMLVSLGCALGVSTFVQYLRMLSKSEVTISFIITWSLGLVFSVIVKMGFYSNNPFWAILNETNGGLNKEGMVLCLIFGMLAPFVNNVNHLPVRKIEEQYSIFAKLAIGVGFGAFFFSIHQLLTDSSTIIYWAWEGYNNNTGPLQWPWSALTCAVMTVAAVSSIYFFNKPLFPSFLLVLSTSVLYIDQITGWNKYLFGGLLYVIALIWLIPTYLPLVSSTQSIVVATLSMIIYNILVLAHVWTVAYAFVPFGWVLRERLPLVLVISSCLILLGLSCKKDTTTKSTVKLTRKFYVFITFFTLVALSLTGGFTYLNRPTGVPQPYHPESKLITAGIWTIHTAIDNDNWASEDRMSKLIKDLEIDVIGLLETDAQHIVMGNRDLTSKLAHDLNMYADYGPGPNKHTWGAVLLSKFPIVNSTHHLMPSPVGELAPVIHATLNTYDDILVDVFVFHSGQEEDVEDRRLQTEKLAELMGATNRPTFLLSYLITKPHEGNYNTHVSDISGMHDIDPSDDDRWCEYILYKNIKRTGYARVARGSITDTELQVGKFQVLNDNELMEAGKSIYNTDYSTEQHDESLKFPDKFKGNGENEHFYHVLKDPRYYN